MALTAYSAAKAYLREPTCLRPSIFVAFLFSDASLSALCLVATCPDSMCGRCPAGIGRRGEMMRVHCRQFV